MYIYCFRFQRRVKQVSKAWHDRPMPPLEAAIYWTEFAARHSNITFRTAAADVPLYQHFYLDIICLFIIFFIALVFILKIFWKLGRFRSGVKLSKKRLDKKSKRA